MLARRLAVLIVLLGAARSNYFPQTGHNVTEPFLRFFERNGGLANFGLPLSEEFTEELPGSGPTTVQYFERARFELQTTGAPPRVGLGLLGA